MSTSYAYEEIVNVETWTVLNATRGLTVFSSCAKGTRSGKVDCGRADWRRGDVNDAQPAREPGHLLRHRNGEMSGILARRTLRARYSRSRSSDTLPRYC
jgi:hypothetical protein